MVNIAKQRAVSLDYKHLVISTLKEKYIFLLLGVLLIIITVISVLSILTKRKPLLTVREKSANNTQVEKSSTQAKKYTIKLGDNLWQIAENEYGSGYNYVDIAKANNISNPDMILSGQIVVFPKVAAKAPTRGEIAKAATAKVTIKENEYAVKKGDYLWKIALEAYGDGYAWSRIATANNLNNPDLIFPDTKLSLPR